MKRFLYDNDLSELPAGIFDELVELDQLCVGMSKKGRAGTDGMAVDGRLAWPAGVAMWWGFGRLSPFWVQFGGVWPGCTGSLFSNPFLFLSRSPFLSPPSVFQ